MRIIAGSLKGRRLESPRWPGLRPTSDKLRETLFNVLTPHVAGARVLDAFAGTGALGIEAVSRGASTVVFIEADPRAQRLIEGNLQRCGITEGCAIIRASVARGLDTLGRAPLPAPFDIVLLDPPYELMAAAVLAGIDRVTRAGGTVVLEHARIRPAPDAAGRLVRLRQVVSGSSALTFYTCQHLPSIPGRSTR